MCIKVQVIKRCRGVISQHLYFVLSVLSLSLSLVSLTIFTYLQMLSMCGTLQACLSTSPTWPDSYLRLWRHDDEDDIMMWCTCFGLYKQKPRFVHNIFLRSHCYIVCIHFWNLKKKLWIFFKKKHMPTAFQPPQSHIVSLLLLLFLYRLRNMATRGGRHTLGHS